MIMTDENPILSLSSLNDIENRIRNNQETEKDYKMLETFISSVAGESTIISKILSNNNIFSFQQYINERRKPIETRNNIMVSGILGTILGYIAALKTYAINNKL